MQMNKTQLRIRVRIVNTNFIRILMNSILNYYHRVELKTIFLIRYHPYTARVKLLNAIDNRLKLIQQRNTDLCIPRNQLV